MTDLYRNKYRIQPARAQWWDYSRDGVYFVTICTHNREYYFGEIANCEMKLSKIGNFAKLCWQQIPNHFPFVQLGASVIA
jgi:hypothetical protein